MDSTLSLPKFLKFLTSNSTLSMAKAMAISGKIYKGYNTPAKLSQLNSMTLNSLGIEDKESKEVMNAIKKAGYSSSPKKAKEEPASGPSSAVSAVITPIKRRRKPSHEDNQFLPKPIDEAAKIGSLEFDEVLDIEVLKTKSTVVNRAPLMTAWATIVAERQGFKREEALSIASVFTEMNAVSKGVSIGIYAKGKDKDLDAAKGGSQPYVELMGRRVPLFRTQEEEWRALSSTGPAQPSTAFSYISRSFRQTTPFIIGSLRLLAESYSTQDLLKAGWSLYADFRPTVDGWGGRGEVKCADILDLRRKVEGKEPPLNTVKRPAEDLVQFDEETEEPKPKKARV